MRDRHFPRLCRACQVPMARQVDTCWHCGTQWATEDAPQTALRLIPATQALQDAERWTDEGGGLEAESIGLPAAAAARS